jgi:toxin ParE1/3/4
MRQTFKVTWAGPARLDLIEIADFIAEESPAAAWKIITKIEEKTDSLYLAPERARIVPELSRQGITQFRELIIFPWRIIFQISGKEVFILLVVDGRRNLEDILFKRLLR